MRFISRYFDAFVEPLFKRDDRGRTVFFFAGQLAGGRLLSDDAAAARMKTTVRHAYMVAFLLLLPILVVLSLANGLTGWRGIVGGMAGGAVISGGLAAWLWLQVRGLPRSDERLTLAEAQAAQSRALGTGWLKALFIGSVVLTGGALLSLALDPKANLASGLTGLVLFGAGSVLFWRQWRQTRSSGSG